MMLSRFPLHCGPSIFRTFKGSGNSYTRLRLQRGRMFEKLRDFRRDEVKRNANNVDGSSISSRVLPFSLSVSLAVMAAPIHSITINNDHSNVEVPSDLMALTHDFLLRQSASIALESSIQFLNHAVVAALDSHSDYQKVTQELMDLMERTLEVLGNEFEQDRLWELIIAARSLMDDCLKTTMDRDALMISAMKLVTLAVETAFTSGCHDYLTASASERIFSAERELNAAKVTTGKLMEAYSELSARSVKITNEYDQKQLMKNNTENYI